VKREEDQKKLNEKYMESRIINNGYVGNEVKMSGRPRPGGTGGK
jgi:hypothetical protein